jgi:glycosyltransferase involved in cell wall biosynthesis
MAERVGRTLGRIARHPKAQGLLRYGGTWAGAYFLRRGLYMPWDIGAAAPSWMPADPDALAESLQQLEVLLEPDPGSDHARVATLESGAYMRNQLLRDSDWASMAHSIELRVPLVDTGLARRIGPRAAPVAGAEPKRLLALAPRKPLPDAIINRPKSGFETPVGEWARTAADDPRAPWSRRWARRVVAERLPKQAPRGLAGSRLRVAQLQRRPVQGNYSVERVFEDVRHHLMHEPDIEIRLHVNDHPSRGSLGRILDAWNARRRQARVTHVTGDVHYLAWWLDPQRTVLTVLDCVNLHRLAGIKRTVFKWLWYSVPVRRARRITVISDFTRRELIAETGCDPAKITVIHPHLSDEFVPSPARFNQARPRVLQIGTAPNKNIQRLLQALAGLPVDLVVIGVLDESSRALAARLGVAVTEKTRLSREQMLDEYRSADIVAFVSTYEGFGLPIIEAQAIGRVVVTGNICSMPEVAGAGAVTVDPTDVAAIRAAFVRLIDDPTHRDAVIAAGLRNVERFRLPAIARQYRDLYRQVADGAQAA